MGEMSTTLKWRQYQRNKWELRKYRFSAAKKKGITYLVHFKKFTRSAYMIGKPVSTRTSAFYDGAHILKPRGVLLIASRSFVAELLLCLLNIGSFNLATTTLAERLIYFRFIIYRMLCRRSALKKLPVGCGKNIPIPPWNWKGFWVNLGCLLNKAGQLPVGRARQGKKTDHVDGERFARGQGLLQGPIPWSRVAIRLSLLLWGLWLFWSSSST